VTPAGTPPVAVVMEIGVLAVRAPGGIVSVTQSPVRPEPAGHTSMTLPPVEPIVVVVASGPSAVASIPPIVVLVDEPPPHAEAPIEANTAKAVHKVSARRTRLANDMVRRADVTTVPSSESSPSTNEGRYDDKTQGQGPSPTSLSYLISCSG